MHSHTGWISYTIMKPPRDILIEVELSDGATKICNSDDTEVIFSARVLLWRYTGIGRRTLEQRQRKLSAVMVKR